jgi:sister-chromatid-cohesion protein PDS5
LIAEISSSARLIQTLYTACFDVLSGPSKTESGEELSKNVEHHMTAILATLVDETHSLPSEVIDTILAQFLRADPRVAVSSVTKGKKTIPVDERQSTLLLKEAPPAYNMAKNICNSCPDKMARYVTRYFSTVIFDASFITNGASAPSKKTRKSIDDLDSDDRPDRPSEEDWQELEKAHGLLRELWRSTPAVLQDIIPSLEGELSSENVNLRVLAVETVGDMISGIGKGGPPPPAALNPTTYPSQSMEPPERPQTYNFLTTPTSPISFISRYHSTYPAFLNRRNDRSPLVRSAWSTAIGRILTTGAGGVGLDPEEERKLLRYLADSLIDVDEKVRQSAVKSIENFDFDNIVQKLGSLGGVTESGSVLVNLADRAKDRKAQVRNDAIKLLGKIWGVAAGAIAEGSERMVTLFGAIPSRILETYYINDPEINALVDRVLFEFLLPLGFPPIKPTVQSGSQHQRSKNSQTGSSNEPDADKIRVERMLVLIRDLEQKAKAVLFAMQIKQTAAAKYMTYFLEKCEAYNGGVMDSDEKDIKTALSKLIDYFSKTLPEPSRASEDLWKFAKMHDRRSYQLIRFCMAPESDYRKVIKAIKELTKRLEDASNVPATLIDTITILVYRCSIILYNRSHVPPIIEISRTDENGLGNTAHEVLKEISKNKSDVFKAHVEELCRSLESEAPTAKKPNVPGAVDDLKACAEFARKFPTDIPKERKFVQALLAFVSHGTPPKAAKYGVFVLLTCTNKKEMYAKDIFNQCTKAFKYGQGNFLAKLAALSQLVLLGAKYIEHAEADVIVDIAINQVLTNPAATSPPLGDETDHEWTDDPDKDCQAKMWALKILANRLRAYPEDEDVTEASEPVFKLLNSLVQKRGQLSQKAPSPKSHQSRLRLLAAQLLLKLCCDRRFNTLFSPNAFNELVRIVQDPCAPVRSGFVNKLMKYLGQNKLAKRFYTYLFLLAFEPITTTKDSAVTWLKSRARQFAKAKDTSMEALFARLLSLLAWHPDFECSEEERVQNLCDFATYIVFYLQNVSTQENLGLIYHVAQRVKSVQDGIDPSKSENLYVLSDLAQAVIRKYEELKGWQLQVWPGKVGMPAGIFASMPHHDKAQEVAMKNYLGEDVMDALEEVVKNALKVKKRKAVGEEGKEKRVKKIKIEKSVPKEKKERKIKTPRKRDVESSSVAPESERRRSGRNIGNKSYVEQSSDEDDEEMQKWDRGGGGKDDDGEQSIVEAEPSSETVHAEEEEAAEDDNGARNQEAVVKQEVQRRSSKRLATDSPKQVKSRAKANVMKKASPKATRGGLRKAKANGIKMTDVFEIPNDKSSDAEMNVD